MEKEAIKPKNNSKCIIITTAIIIILITAIIIIIVFATKKSKSKKVHDLLVITEDHILNYHLNNKNYFINSYFEERTEEYYDFQINVEDLTANCSQGVCDKPSFTGKKINNKEDSIILTSLIKNIFNNTSKTYMSVNDDNITSQNVEKILDVLEHNNLISKLEYEIIETNEIYNSNYSIRGYSYRMDNESVIYTIAMGEKNTGGYDIKAKKVEIKNNNAIIHISESWPKENEIVPPIITYPITKVKFSRLPRNITIINDETREKFYKI